LHQPIGSVVRGTISQGGEPGEEKQEGARRPGCDNADGGTNKQGNHLSVDGAPPLVREVVAQEGPRKARQERCEQVHGHRHPVIARIGGELDESPEISRPEDGHAGAEPPGTPKTDLGSMLPRGLGPRVGSERTHHRIATFGASPVHGRAREVVSAGLAERGTLGRGQQAEEEESRLHDNDDADRNRSGRQGLTRGLPKDVAGHARE